MASQLGATAMECELVRLLDSIGYRETPETKKVCEILKREARLNGVNLVVARNDFELPLWATLAERNGKYFESRDFGPPTIDFMVYTLNQPFWWGELAPRRYTSRIKSQPGCDTHVRA